MELSQSAGELAVGQRVAELRIDYSRERVTEYEDVVPHYQSIHDSNETAMESGFSQPFASGTMIGAYITERLFPEVFGDGWTRAGSWNCAFIRPVLIGSQVTLAADMIAKLPKGDNSLIVMKLSATLESGEPLIVGQASALAKG